MMNLSVETAPPPDLESLFDSDDKPLSGHCAFDDTGKDQVSPSQKTGFWDSDSDDEQDTFLNNLRKDRATSSEVSREVVEKGTEWLMSEHGMTEQAARAEFEAHVQRSTLDNAIESLGTGISNVGSAFRDGHQQLKEEIAQGPSAPVNQNASFNPLTGLSHFEEKQSAVVLGEAISGVGEVISMVGHTAGRLMARSARAIGVSKGVAQDIGEITEGGIEWAVPVGVGNIGRLSKLSSVPRSIKGLDLAGVETKTAPLYWNKNKHFTFNGQTNKVYQRNDLIEPSLTDAKGRTNLERMKRGLAPVSADKKPINLHHMLQTQEGPLAEMAQFFHQRNYSVIHINPASTPSGIDRTLHDQWRSKYWKSRGKDFE